MTHLNKKVLSLFLALIIAICSLPCIAFAQNNNDSEKVTAYLTVSLDGILCKSNESNNNQSIALLPIEVEYFDLDDYGLKEFNRYETGENNEKTLIRKPTLLHLMIKATEQYYLGGKKLQVGEKEFSVSGSAGSMWITSFWDESNMSYTVNHIFDYNTADTIELKNDDVIDISLFNDDNYWNDFSATYFTHSNYNVVKNRSLSFNINKISMMSAQPQTCENMKVFLVNDKEELVANLSSIAASGEFSYLFNTEGDYYLIAVDNDTLDSSYYAPAVAKIKVTSKEYENLLAPESEWSNFRGNENNNAVTNAKLPTSADETSLIWASEIGTGWDAPSQPIIVEDYLITYSAKRLIKLNKKTGEIVAESTMAESPSYSLEPPVYANGMIFVALSKGTVQAFDVSSLNSLWIYKDELGGQPNSPITVKNGYLYTGFWTSETENANYICLDVTDENKSENAEEKLADWTYTQKGGFYFAGSYACNKFVTVGTADGETGCTSQTSNLITFNPENGEIIDKLSDLNGDICSTIAYDNETNRCYFTSKNGSFYSVSIDENGKIASDDVKEIKLSGQTTSTPALADGRAYIGVCGTSTYKEGSGHHIAVIDLEKFEIAYKVYTDGYVQSSGLITTAYKDKDGYNYIYFTENKSGASIFVIKDKKSVTNTVDGVSKTYNIDGENVTLNNCAPTLFTPVNEQANYCTGSLVCDNEGTIYFKNDSCFLMALGSAVKNISVTAKPNKTSYYEGESFSKTGLKVTAEYANETKKDITDSVKISADKLSINDKDVTISYKYGIYGNRNGESGVSIDSVSTFTDISVSHKTKVTGKVNATYFSKGYTGNTVCSICGKTIAKGKSVAKLILKKPNVTVKGGSKIITVKYKKVTGATGFQVKYKLKGKKEKTINVKTKKNLKKVFKKLKKGKYTVKVRAYVKKTNKKAYSKWTKTKTVTVK